MSDHLRRYAPRPVITEALIAVVPIPVVPGSQFPAKGIKPILIVFSFKRHREVVYEEIHHRPPKEILADLAKLETEIKEGMKELEGMLR